MDASAACGGAEIRSRASVSEDHGLQCRRCDHPGSWEVQKACAVRAGAIYVDRTVDSPLRPT